MARYVRLNNIYFLLFYELTNIKNLKIMYLSLFFYIQLNQLLSDNVSSLFFFRVQVAQRSFYKNANHFMVIFQHCPCLQTDVFNLFDGNFI